MAKVGIGLKWMGWTGVAEAEKNEKVMQNDAF